MKNLNSNIMRPCVFLILGTLFFSIPVVYGFAMWEDGCIDCHGSFLASPYEPPLSAPWPDSLHVVHQSMVTDCMVCHNSRYDHPPLNTSQRTAHDVTPGYGCTGCHGRVYAALPESRGLREMHRNNGYDGCSGSLCHASPEIPDPENVSPLNYDGILTIVSDPCNYPPDTLEDYSGDNFGLDNDGDLDLDAEDPDCPALPTPTVTGTFTPTSDLIPSPTETSTFSPTRTPTISPTSTVTPSHSITPVPFTGTPTITPTVTETPVVSPTPTSSVPTPTPTLSPTPVPSADSNFLGILFAGFGVLIVYLVRRSTRHF